AHVALRDRAHPIELHVLHGDLVAGLDAKDQVLDAGLILGPDGPEAGVAPFFLEEAADLALGLFGELAPEARFLPEALQGRVYSPLVDPRAFDIHRHPGALLDGVLDGHDPPVPFRAVGRTNGRLQIALLDEVLLQAVGSFDHPLTRELLPRAHVGDAEQGRTVESGVPDEGRRPDRSRRRLLGGRPPRFTRLLE